MECGASPIAQPAATMALFGRPPVGLTRLHARRYGWCADNGYWTGSVWWLCGVLGGLLPQLLLQGMPASSFEVPESE